MNTDTSKNDGAGCNAPTSNGDGCGGAILCIDAAEARLMRKHGHRCITSPKLRNLITHLLETRADNAAQEAVNAIGRLGGVSTADAPDRWSMWTRDSVKALNGVAEVRAALAALPAVETLLRDPEKPAILGELEMWTCKGTTVLVGRDTFELVRVADTYAGSKLYRPHRRMDEPFTPAVGRVCLITDDELRLVRFDGVEDAEIVLTYADEPQKMTGGVVTPWPTSVRALCAEYPGLRVGLATFLVSGRHGYPFFLGITRGLGFESIAKNDAHCPAALAWCIQTNSVPEAVSLRVVSWAGGDNVRQLARYGGLTIFTGRETRRKVQLRSLGLVRSGTAAGAAIYDLSANYNTLTKWAITRTFVKPAASQRARDHRRVRPGKALAQSTRGTYIIQDTSPRRIQRARSAARREATTLRKFPVGDLRCVTAVPLMSLGIGGCYLLNGRTKLDKEGEFSIDAKRSKIRCPRWTPKDAAALLTGLAEDASVVFAGREPTGEVFAVVKVANGTEDQQREAVSRWSHRFGLLFPDPAGCASWIKGSIAYDSSTVIASVSCVNWKALSLETTCFERYQTTGDYSKPLKLTRRGCATLSERVRAYVDTVPLADEGSRNTNLSTAVFKMVEHFGKEAAADALPYLLAKSTLPEKEKRKTALRILYKPEREQS